MDVNNERMSRSINRGRQLQKRRSKEAVSGEDEAGRRDCIDQAQQEVREFMAAKEPARKRRPQKNSRACGWRRPGTRAALEAGAKAVKPNGQGGGTTEAE
jgi:hypothetical protein